MIFDYSLAGVVSLGLLVYLTYALLRPERFWPCSCFSNCCWRTPRSSPACSRWSCRSCAGHKI